MIQVHQLLHVGSERDYEDTVRHLDGWRVVHACKDPYHRAALGYSGRAAPKNNSEYLVARRESRLILNLVDAPDPAYIPIEIIDAALAFVHQSLREATNVLVHCNEGASRAPSIALLYLLSHTGCLPRGSAEAAIEGFREIYPVFAPAAGVRGFITSNFARYCALGDSMQVLDG